MKSVRLLVCLMIACSQPSGPSAPASPRSEPAQPAAVPAPAAPAPITISIIGTNDLHGALERLPMFGGFVANLRAARAADGGGVLLLDGGDMFQGTLESNLSEGADVVRAYNQLGYTAVAVGNHEFDYGPEGPEVTAKAAGDDPRGALKARAKEAKYPFVSVNILDAATDKPPGWANMPPAALVEIAGVKIGVIGASTESTPHTTMPANVVGLKVVPPVPGIAEQAEALRAKGAQIVVATMHIGANCKKFDNPDDLSSCDKTDELFRLTAGLPKGAVDVIVGGHTHAGVAHRIDGIAVIESFANGRAFGRVDLQIAPDGKLADVRIAKPQRICQLDANNNPLPIAQCAPGDYEGKPVVADAELQKIVDAAMANAGERRKEKLGVTVPAVIRRAWAAESALGNLFTDLMLAARPDAQLAIINGGGLRADIPAGELTYGQLFEAMPFDNRFAILDLSGADVRTILLGNLGRGGGILSWGGLTAKLRCKAGKPELDVRVAGKPLVDKKRYKLAASDFLVSGGDQAFVRLKLPASAIVETNVIIREAFSDVLRAWKTTPKAVLDPSKLYSTSAPRLDYEGARPVACVVPAPAKDPTP